MEQGRRYSYTLFNYEPGIFAEVYLPKKSLFQGTLYDALTNGFSITNIKNHFKNRGKEAKIRALLKRYDAVHDYTDDTIDQFPFLFYGYSMYEVDGVFYSNRKSVQEERTQIIRIMFMPDMDSILKKYPTETEEVRRITRRYFADLGKTKEYIREKDLTRMESDIVTHLEKWVNYVGLFMFGYIVFDMCERIVGLCEDGKMKWKEAEDEIWVTAFWNLVVYKASFKTDKT